MQGISIILRCNHTVHHHIPGTSLLEDCIDLAKLALGSPVCISVTETWLFPPSLIALT